MSHIAKSLEEDLKKMLADIEWIDSEPTEKERPVRTYRNPSPSQINFHDSDEWYEQQLERDRRVRKVVTRVTMVVVIVTILIAGCGILSAIDNQVADSGVVNTNPTP